VGLRAVFVFVAEGGEIETGWIRGEGGHGGHSGHGGHGGQGGHGGHSGQGGHSGHHGRVARSVHQVHQVHRVHQVHQVHRVHHVHRVHRPLSEFACGFLVHSSGWASPLWGRPYWCTWCGAPARARSSSRRSPLCGRCRSAPSGGARCAICCCCFFVCWQCC